MAFSHYIDYILEGIKSLSCFSFILIPIFILCVPNVNCTSKTFNAFRIQQFDLHGIPFGSRNVLLNTEARASLSANIVRKSFIIYLHECKESLLDKIVYRVASLIIIVPDFHNYTQSEREILIFLEQKFLSTQINIPVYLLEQNENIIEIISEIKNQDNNYDSTVKELYKSSIMDTYYLTYKTKDKTKSTSTTSKSMPNFELINVMAKFSGSYEEENPTIVIMTHYDTFGLSPALAYGCESNGSGLAAFLEIARILKIIFDSKYTKPKFNIVLVLTAGGKYSFLGAKKWAQNLVEHTDSSIAISDIAFILCLDTIGRSITNDSTVNQFPLHLHMMKPPKNNDFLSKFISHFDIVTKPLHDIYPSNISKERRRHHLANAKLMNWEHDPLVLTIKNVPALTISTFSDPTDKHDSITDIGCMSLITSLSENTKGLVESLLRFLYFSEYDDVQNVTSTFFHHNNNILDNYTNIDLAHLKFLMETFSQYPRSQPLLTKESHILSFIMNHFSRMVGGSIRILPFSADKKDPEYQFYDNFEGSITFHKSKPAIFDLILSGFVIVYLGIIYLLILILPWIINHWYSMLEYLVSQYIKQQESINNTHKHLQSSQRNTKTKDAKDLDNTQPSKKHKKKHEKTNEVYDTNAKYLIKRNGFFR